MFVVFEEAATAIRAAFDQGGALAAAVEVRRLFPGISDNVQARAIATTIAGWTPTGLLSRSALDRKRRRTRPAAPSS